MKHVKEHIKPYIPLLIASIIFIAAQAYFNLMLPNVMSQLVNMGIQEYFQKISAATGERARALISIAHPSVREELERAAAERYGYSFLRMKG